ncbi:MAG: type II toxin-antitoxin system RelE/ParE family toxin [bacterium]
MEALPNLSRRIGVGPIVDVLPGRDQALRGTKDGAPLSNVHRRVSRKILSLEENPYPRGSQRLKAGEGCRLRVGDYRILYTVDTRNRKVLIYSVAHRSEAYRI